MGEKEVNSYKEEIAALNMKIAYLEQDNTQLSETVEWMHKLIWDLYKRLRITVN